MFERIRWRLALSTAVAVTLFLAIGSAMTYGFVRDRLYRQFDRVTAVDLHAAYRRLSRSPDQAASHLPVFLSPVGSWPRPLSPLAVAFWSSSGTLIEAPAFLDAASRRTLALHLTHEPRTLFLQGHWLRVYIRRVPAAWVRRHPDMSTWRMQIIKNCESVVLTLRTLIGILVIVLGVSAAASVLLGLWVAGRALVPVRRAWDRQRQFVSDASHELRTPLMAAQARTELLLGSPETSLEEAAPQLLSLFAELRRLGRMVEDLLSLSHADAGEQQADLRPVSIDQVVRDVAEQIEPLCAGRRIALALRGEAHFVRRVDERRFRELLLILLDNAIRYNVAGGRIEVVWEAVDHRWRLLVRDTGVGMTPETLSRIFDRFYRGDPARTDTEGFGLGLAIANWIVRLHQAKIEVRSTPGTGTEFAVIFAHHHPSQEGGRSF